MASKRPIRDEASLLSTADKVWRALSEADWLEPFQSHARIGESRSEQSIPAQSSAWAGQETQRAAAADEAGKKALKCGNREYAQNICRAFSDYGSRERATG